MDAAATNSRPARKAEWNPHKATHVPNRRGGISPAGPRPGDQLEAIAGSQFGAAKGAARGARTQNGKVSPIRPGRPDSHRCGSGFTRPGGTSATTIRPADVAVAPRERSGRVQTGSFSSSSSPGRVTE